MPLMNIISTKRMSYNKIIYMTQSNCFKIQGRFGISGIVWQLLTSQSHFKQAILGEGFMQVGTNFEVKYEKSN